MMCLERHAHPKSILFILLGLIGLILDSTLTVENAVFLANTEIKHLSRRQLRTRSPRI